MTQEILESGGYNLSAITVRQLLQHVSRLPDYNSLIYRQLVLEEPRHRWTRREQVKWALNHGKPIGTPGLVFAYSDTGYILLGEIIEQVSGLPQARAYRDLLGFDRLGLRETWFESLQPAPQDLPARAHQFYGPIDATDFDPSFDLWGGGGLTSTAADEAKFLRSLMTGLVFERSDTLGVMLTVPATNAESGYGDGNLASRRRRDCLLGSLGLLGHGVLLLSFGQRDRRV